MTPHAKERLVSRTALSEEELFEILARDEETIPLGYEIGTHRMNRLFYSQPDDGCFVAVIDEETETVITILPVDYSPRCKIDPDVLSYFLACRRERKDEHSEEKKFSSDPRQCNYHILIHYLDSTKGRGRGTRYKKVKMPVGSAPSRLLYLDTAFKRQVKDLVLREIGLGGVVQLVFIKVGREGKYEPFPID